MPKRNRHLPARPLIRLLQFAVTLAMLAAVVVVSYPDDAHPPERIVTSSIAIPINPTALPDVVTTTTTTTVEPTPVPDVGPQQPVRLQPVEPPVWAGSGDVLAAIAAHFGDVYDQAVAVARCESTLNPGAISGPNYGLFQINRVHRARVEAMGFTWGQILDADVNATVARAIYDEQGWGPWACRWAARG